MSEEVKTPNLEEPSLGQGSMDHDGFTKQLADNCVEYALFIIHSQLDTRKQLSQIESVRKSALQFCESLTKTYIWQKDEFNLELKNEQGKSLKPSFPKLHPLLTTIMPRTCLSPRIDRLWGCGRG